MQSRHLISSIYRATAIIGILVAQATILTAAPPSGLTGAQLDELNRQAATVSTQINHHRQESQQAVTEVAKRATDADATMRPFLTSIGQERLLAQNNTPTPATTPSVAASTTPPAETGKTEKTTTKKARKTKTTTIKVECDGGLYFDGDEGLLAYLENIRLTDSESRFKLTCSDELKVFLEQKPEEPKKKTDPKVKQAKDGKATDAKKTDPQKKGDKEKGDKKKDNSFAEFGKLKQIIASGNVRVSGKDSKGNPFIASGDTASYNAITGEMILKGGHPTLQQSANQYFQAREPGQWIRIRMKDKRIHSIITSKGKWAMQATTQ